MYLVDVRPSANPSKKLTAFFSDGSKTDFGAAGYMDYTLYAARNPREARKKRAAYIARHRVHEDWTDPKRPGTLSRILLWEYPTVEEARAKYNRTLAAWRKNPRLKYI